MNKKSIENIYPLSPQQQGTLFESLYSSEAGIQGAHIEQFTCVLHGSLDVTTFKRAWHQVLGRHSMLRTAFVWKEQDEPLQAVLRHVEVPLEYQDWRHLAPVEQQARLQAYLVAERRRGFELTMAPLIRVVIFRMGDDTHRLAWSFHHILMDGWSHALMMADLFSAYLTLVKAQNLPDKPTRSYRDYIAWLKRQDLSDAKHYWQEALRGFTRPTPLGTEVTLDDSLDQKELYGYQSSRLSATRTKILRTWVQQQRLTLNTLVQGIWALLLSRYSGQSDIIFGTTISGRPPNLAGVESMVGLFTNTLPLRVQVLPQARLRIWLQELQQRQLDLQQHGYCSAGQIHRWSEMPGMLPLYESLLVFENYPVDFLPSQTTDLAFEIGDTQTVGAQTNHALALVVTAGQQIELQLVYQHSRLDSDSVSKILIHFIDLLESIAVNLDQPLTTLLSRIHTDQIPRVRPLQKDGTYVSSAAFVAPRTPTEEALARIWAGVLGVEQVGVHHSFFELGGYSLLAIEIVSQIRDAFQVDLPLRFLLEAPTIAELAVVIAQKQAKQVDTETLEQLLTELERTSPERVQTTQAAQQLMSEDGTAND